MKQGQKRARVGELMTRFMDRAEVGDSELGRRIGMSRVTVARWHGGEAVPQEESIRKLKTALRWVDSTGVVRELDDSEVDELRVAAGYHIAPPQPEMNRAERTDRCIVYSSRYAPDAFPSQWSNRVIELERAIPGSIATMWNTLPSITRPPAFYSGAHKRDIYRQDKVEAYMAAHEARQQGFLKRLEGSYVRHLYSKKGVDSFLGGASAGGRPEWDFWRLPRPVLVKQLDMILDWMDRYENFEVRYRESDVPGNVTIIGHDVVLTEFSLYSSLRTTDNINGLELIGTAASVQFTKQFESYWSDKETVKKHEDVTAWLKGWRTRILATAQKS